MKASYHGPPGYFVNNDMLMAFKDTFLLKAFKDTFLLKDGTCDFTSELRAFLEGIPQLPLLLQNWSKVNYSPRF
jgi:hypothetical protein